MTSVTKTKQSVKAKPGKALTTPAELKAVLKRVRALDIDGPVVIKTAEQYIAAAERLKQIKGFAEQIGAQKKEQIKPLKDHLKWLGDLFGEHLQELTDAEGRHKAAIAKYDEDQKLLQIVEQRKADERADKERAKITAQIETAQITARNEAKELRRDAKAAASVGDKVKAAALRGKAEKIEARMEARIERLTDKVDSVIAPIIQREAPRVVGLSNRKVWKFQITDPSKVNRPFTCPDLEKIGTHVTALGPDAQSAVGDGVRIYEDAIIASTSEAA